jgi:hypothetical protein
VEAESEWALLTPLFLKGDPPLDDELMLDPAGRRRWLLTKAMETAPLGEALALAQAAEDFLSGTARTTIDRTSSGVIGVPTFEAGPEAEAPRLKLLSAVAGKSDQPLKMTGAVAGLSSLAAIDDVILYLRQHGEVFAEDESADELLIRANLKRVEQGLPPFALLPRPPTKVLRQDKPEKVTVPRPPSGRERAEWARSVLGLPAE